MFDSNQFKEDGFAVIENFLTIEEADSLINEVQLLVDDYFPDNNKAVFSTINTDKNIRDEYFITSNDKIRFFFEENALDKDGKLIVEKHLALNKIGHALHALNETFIKITFSEKIKNLSRALNYVKPTVVQSMIIFKQPRIGGEVGGHQDGSYLYTNPLNGFGLWFALEDATIENGCLKFIPQSHKNTKLDNDYRLVRCENEGKQKCYYIGEKPSYDSSLFVPVPVKKGSVILIDSLVVHASDENKSCKSRKAFTLHIYDASSSTWDNSNWLTQSQELNNFIPLY